MSMLWTLPLQNFLLFRAWVRFEDWLVVAFTYIAFGAGLKVPPGLR
jgi:hypothetical protein